jgi:hypothetical protein
MPHPGGACPLGFLDGFAAREEVDDQRNHGDDQQKVDQAAGDVESEEAGAPQAHQNQEQ